MSSYHMETRNGVLRILLHRFPTTGELTQFETDYRTHCKASNKKMALRYDLRKIPLSQFRKIGDINTTLRTLMSMTETHVAIVGILVQNPVIRTILLPIITTYNMLTDLPHIVACTPQDIRRGFQQYKQAKKQQQSS